jgi:tryptophan 7-halogenase
MHYMLTKRADSAFWRDNVRAESIPERLGEQLALWRHLPPSRYDFHRVEEVFPSASYQYVLYGMGFRPDVRRAGHGDRADDFFREAATLTGRMLAGLPPNRALIEHIRQNGLSKI